MPALAAAVLFVTPFGGTVGIALLTSVDAGVSAVGVAAVVVAAVGGADLVGTPSVTVIVPPVSNVSS